VADNVAATSAFVAAAGAAGCRRAVLLGSSTEYAPLAGPLPESAALNPVSLHGATKAAGTFACRAIARRVGVALTVLRPFAVYGPGDDPGHLVPTAIDAALQDRTLRVAPRGRRDWVYVDDVAEAVLRAVDAGLEDAVVNVGTGRQWTNGEVVAHVAAACGTQIRVVTDEAAGRPWDREDWVADVRHAQAVLGWTARWSLPDGLAATVAWQRDRVGAAA
jgi:nucleoside-diphosphate-sugar epimerase